MLLHCGGLTPKGGINVYKKLFGILGKVDAELKLVIAGNHGLDLGSEFWARNYDAEDLEYKDDKVAKAFMRCELARQAGVMYLEEGLNTFMLKNGATFTIYTSPYQPEFCYWAFPYERDEDRFNPPGRVAPGVKSIVKNPIPEFTVVDIMMTYGLPKDILDWTRSGNVGCEALLKAESLARPRLYCFGHIHEAYGASGQVEERYDKNWCRGEGE